MELRRASTVLGCGCAVVIAVFLAAVLSLTFATYRAGKDFERVARDPQAAAARARQVVEFGELPEGYRAFGALRVPLLLDVAFFMGPLDEAAGGEAAAEGAAEASGAAGGEPALDVDRGFLYVRLRDWMGRGDELREALGGGAADEAPLAQRGLDFDPGEVVARGRLVSGQAEVQWLARRGHVRIDPQGFGRSEARVVVADREAGGGEAGDSVLADDRLPGVLTVLAFDCPGDDSWQRLGVWFAPDPAPESPAGEVDWSGGPGDPAAIADLLGRFELCG